MLADFRPRAFQSVCRASGGLAVGVWAVLMPAQAADYTPVFRELQRIQNNQLEQERIKQQNLEREIQQESARQQAVAEEEARKRAEAIEQKRRNERAEAVATSPPDAYRDYLPLHRDLLTRSEAPPPDRAIEISPRAGMTFSDDERRVAYVDREGQLVVEDLMSGQRIVFPMANPQKTLSSTVQWRGDYLLLSKEGPDSLELFDSNGRSLKSWTGMKGYFAGGRASPGMKLILFSGEPSAEGGWSQVSVYDVVSGKETSVDFGSSQRIHSSRVRKDASLELLTEGSGRFSYYVDGRNVSQFKGNVGMAWRFFLDVPYAISYSYSGDKAAYLWALNDGRLLCLIGHGDYSAFFQFDSDIFYSAYPAGRFSLSSCQFSSMGSPSARLTRFKSALILDDGDAGKVDVVEPGGNQIVKSFSVSRGRWFDWYLDGVEVLLRADTDEYKRLEAYSLVSGERILDLTVSDNESIYGSALPKGGWVLGRVFYGLGDGRRQEYRLWRVASLVNSGLNQLLAQSRKDRFESAEAFRKRVAGLRMPYEMRVELGEYDADQGRFQARWRGASLSIPVAPEVARKFGDARTATLRGKLQVLDDQFFRLADASIVQPDGGLVSLPQPAHFPGKPAVRMTATDKDEGMASPVASPFTGPAVASCAGSLAEIGRRIPAFSAPELASIRREIVGMSIPTIWASAKEQGYDASRAADAARQQAFAQDKVAREAAVTAGQTDAGSGSIEKAKAGTLPLNFACSGAHGNAVCAYLINTWSAMASREVAQRIASCR